MTEHLFKLKKDGKTVRYERYVYCDQREGYVKGKSLVPQHSKDGIHWEYIYLWELKTVPKGYWFEAQLDKEVYIEHDEKCRFVTKDKNGKDVFAGDKVKGVISDVTSVPLIGEIVPNINPLSCWMFKYKLCEGNKEYLAPAPDLQDIELIEAPENDV